MVPGLAGRTNWNRILAALAAILVLGALAAWFYVSKPEAVQEVPGSVTVTPLHSDVFLKAAGADFQLVEEQLTTSGSPTIRTSATGRALIESSSAHRTLVDYSSEIVLNENDGNRTRVGLLGGAVWSRLEKVFDSGEYYEIKTGNTVAVVRGTSFGVWHDSGVTTLIVLEGSVVFSAVDPATGLVVPGSEVTVGAGMKAVRDGNGAIVVTDITKEDRERPWVLFNDSDDSPGAVPTVPSQKTPTAGQEPSPTTPAPVGQSPYNPLPPPTPTPTPAPEISRVSPSKTEEDSSERVTITGTGFTGAAAVRVGGTQVSFEVVRDTLIAFYADNIDSGTYDVTVVGVGSRADTQARALTVVKAPVEQEPDQSQGFNQNLQP